MTVFERIRNWNRSASPELTNGIHCVDLHTGGEPLRVILNGFPEPEGSSVLERRRYCRDHLDHFRRALIWEPRGHADMYGCLLVPPNDEGADFGVIFLHNEGYSTMCGHATIALTKLAAVQNWKERDPASGNLRLTIDTPCGRITSELKQDADPAFSIEFLGVPSFVVAVDQQISVPGHGIVYYDIAYGGAFYAYVQAEQLGLKLCPDNYRQIIDLGILLKKQIATASRNLISHPFESDLSFLYGTIFIDHSDTPGVDSRNICVFADGELDRCPTGSGASGRVAIHHAKDELTMGETMTIESIIGSRFQASVHRLENYGPFEAVIPKISGNAYLTGEHNFVLSSDDPYRHGFFLR